MTSRFGERASIEYVDATTESSRTLSPSEIAVIAERGLIYPVTFIDGAAVYDGAVSYPAILRAVEARLTEVAG